MIKLAYRCQVKIVGAQQYPIPYRMLLMAIVAVKVPLLVLLRLPKVLPGSLNQGLQVQDRVPSPSMAASLHHHIQSCTGQQFNDQLCGHLPSSCSQQALTYWSHVAHRVQLPVASLQIPVSNVGLTRALGLLTCTIVDMVQRAYTAPLSTGVERTAMGCATIAKEKHSKVIQLKIWKEECGNSWYGLGWLTMYL